MSHRCLFRLGKTATSYSNYCSMLHKGRELHMSNVINNKTGNHEDTSSENISGDQSRASSYHQQFRRTSYERKRSNYQDDQGSSRRAPFVTTTPPQNHYQRLNVDQTADTSVIKTSYYNLSKQYHPDIVGQDNPNAAEDFRLITESYDILCDPKLRAEYDSSIAPAQQEPIFTAWNPSKSTPFEQDQIYRMREAGRIFKNRQEEALEREKLRNPRKFRAGAFKYDDEQDMKYISDKMARRSMFVRNMQSTNNVYNGIQDGSHFYRLHLYDSLLRKKEDLHQMSQSSSSADGKEADYTVVVALALVLGILGSSAYFIAGLIYDVKIDIDIADYLDQALESKVDEIKNKIKGN